MKMCKTSSEELEKVSGDEERERERETRSRHDGEFVNSRGRAARRYLSCNTYMSEGNKDQDRGEGGNAAQSSSLINNCFSSRFPNWILFMSLCLFHEPPVTRCRQPWNDPHQPELTWRSCEEQSAVYRSARLRQAETQQTVIYEEGQSEQHLRT